MNIIEAIKSKKPFKRDVWESSGYLKEYNGSICSLVSEYYVKLYADDIIADDWEVFEEPKEPVRKYFCAFDTDEHYRWESALIGEDEIKKQGYIKAKVNSDGYIYIEVTDD